MQGRGGGSVPSDLWASPGKAVRQILCGQRPSLGVRAGVHPPALLHPVLPADRHGLGVCAWRPSSGPRCVAGSPERVPASDPQSLHGKSRDGHGEPRPVGDSGILDVLPDDQLDVWCDPHGAQRRLPGPYAVELFEDSGVRRARHALGQRAPAADGGAYVSFHAGEGGRGTRSELGGLDRPRLGLRERLARFPVYIRPALPRLSVLSLPMLAETGPVRGCLRRRRSVRALQMGLRLVRRPVSKEYRGVRRGRRPVLFFRVDLLHLCGGDSRCGDRVGRPADAAGVRRGLLTGDQQEGQGLVSISPTWTANARRSRSKGLAMNSTAPMFSSSSNSFSSWQPLSTITPPAYRLARISRSTLTPFMPGM